MAGVSGSKFDELSSSVVEHAQAEEEREWPALRQISNPDLVHSMVEQMRAVTTLAEGSTTPGATATFERMQEWAKAKLPRPPTA